MIRSLTGVIAHASPSSVVIVVQGVGYLVAVPQTSAFTPSLEPITLHTHLAVRENALDLYGFVSPFELEVFELLLLVPKIGPKSALQIMSQATPTLLLEAIGKKDATYLHKLSGIGKKTCENIVQFLHEKIDGMRDSDTPVTLASATQTDAIDALVSLGYDLTTARTIIRDIDDGNATVNQLVTQALKYIA